MEKTFNENELKTLIGHDLKIITPENRIAVMSLLNLCTNIPSYIGKAMIFYQTGYDVVHEVRNGHWCCIAIRYPDVFFFDSLGLFPDDELNKIPYSYRIRTNQNERLLGHILFEAKKRGFNIHYNNSKLQQDGKGINTCGRYCVMFLNEAIKANDPYKYMVERLDPYKEDGERFYDNAIVKYIK